MPHAQQYIPVPQIARRHGCHPKTMLNRITRAGIERINLNPHGEKPRWAIRPEDEQRLLEAPERKVEAIVTTKVMSIDDAFNVPGWRT